MKPGGDDIKERRDLWDRASARTDRTVSRAQVEREMRPLDRSSRKSSRGERK